MQGRKIYTTTCWRPKWIETVSTAARYEQVRTNMEPAECFKIVLLSPAKHSMIAPTLRTLGNPHLTCQAKRGILRSRPRQPLTALDRHLKQNQDRGPYHSGFQQPCEYSQDAEIDLIRDSTVKNI